MPSHRRLQQYAIAISIISLFYNTAEGAVSIIFGAESSSRALVFYGLQSVVEVISDFLVAWRFLSVFKSGNELENLSRTKIIQVERISTIIIGGLLAALTITAIATSAASLAAHDHPSTSLPSILIAAISTGFTLLMYFAKRYLARALDSSVLHGEALCALCCSQLSVVLLLGSLIYREWKGGWWVDSATAMVIALMFGWEGIKMVRWARNEEFNGGCCAHSKDTVAPGATTPPMESEESKGLEQKRYPCSTQCHGCSKKEEAVDRQQV